MNLKIKYSFDFINLFKDKFNSNLENNNNIL